MSEQTESPLRQDFALELEHFQRETHARPDELAAIRRRIRAAAPERTRPPLRLLSIGFGGLATAAAAVLGVSLLAPDDPVPIQQLTLSAETWSEVTASEDVTVGFSGQGDLRTEGHIHEIDWKSGRLSVSVVPDQGVDLTVRTPEARVLVVGTVFEVRRDLLGTTVTVERGKVQVSCGEGAPFYLTAEDAPATCLPTTAVGMLNRAQDLRATDADAALEAIDVGLSMIDETSTDFDELHYEAAEIHREAGRPVEALVSARHALTGGDGTWSDKVYRLAVEEAIKQETTAESLSWLIEHEAAESQGIALLADHIAADDPAMARTWLELAEARTADPGLKEMIRSRIERLSP